MLDHINLLLSAVQHVKVRALFAGKVAPLSLRTFCLQ